MNRLVFDLETDNLYPGVTRIHCLSIRSTSAPTDETLYADQPGYQPLEAGLSRLASADVLIGHNIVQFDLPVIRKLYPEWTYTGEVRDTLLASRLVFTDIRGPDFDLFHKKKLPGALIGSHSLKAWGYRLGVLKGEYGEQDDAWEQFTPEMAEYCSRDTLVTLTLYRRIARAGISLPALQIEQELAEYLFQQELNGWPFDVEKARALQAKLAAKREELGEILRKQFGTWTVNLGMFTPKINNKKLGYIKGVPCQKIKVVTFNPRSTDHIADRLQKLYGWKPTAFAEKTGKPMVTANVLKGLQYPGIEHIKELLLVNKRLGQLAEGTQAWLKTVKDTGLIHHRCNQLGAVTHRMTHSYPNVAQVPRVGSPYGEECRELFTVPPGWTQVGCDLSGIELRCLAHYMAKYDNGAYTKLVTESDPHAATRDALELEPTKENRDKAKTAMYCLIYGGGDEKFGSIIMPGAGSRKQKQAGQKYRALLMKNMPALGYLTRDVAGAAKRGYLTILDGRRVSVRHEHAAFNTLLQSTAAVIARYWVVDWSKAMTVRFGPPSWQGQWVGLGIIHDEIESAARIADPEQVGKMCADAAAAQAARFDFRCPIAAEYKIGLNWRDVH